MGALLALPLLLAPAPALADVTVRVEGETATLLPQTTVAETGAPVDRNGGTCGATTGAGALDRATAGAWTGTWNAAFGDWEVTGIAGEEHSFAAAAYWGFFVNEVPAPLGICGQQLQKGDHLLFAPAPTSFDPVGVLRLAGVPERVVPGAPFTVTVTRVLTTYDSSYNPVTTADPVAGAAIEAGGAALGATAADGTARVTLAAGGPATLRATRAGDVRSAGAATCATTGADGFCGTTIAAAGGAAGAGGSGGVAGAGGAAPASGADGAPALGRIAGLRERQRFPRGRGPRTLRGVVDPGPRGLRDVRLRLTRRIPATPGGRQACAAYDAVREGWVGTRRCGAAGGRWFSVGDRAAWSYLLPERLGPGRYVLDVQTVDGAGIRSPLGVRARDAARQRTQVVFLVER